MHLTRRKPWYLTLYERHSDVLLVSLILIPILVVGAIALRMLYTEQWVQLQKSQTRYKWLAQTADVQIQSHIEDRIDAVFTHVATISDDHDLLRIWEFNHIEVELVSVYSNEGERLFPATAESTLVKEKILLDRFRSEIAVYFSTHINDQSVYQVLSQDQEGANLLACDTRRQRAICILFNQVALSDWLVEAQQQLKLPPGLSISIVKSTAPIDNEPVFFVSMAGAFSSWNIALFDEQSVVNSNPTSLYLAILLPLCLLVAGCGAGLFWMVRFKARQAKEQQQFSAELAHEVRTPLANIRLYIELIIRTSTTEQDKFCSVVVSEIERLSLLVDNAILMARPQNTVAAPVRERVEPDQLIRQTLDMMWPVLNVHGCEIESDLNVNQAVDMDRDALQRVLINLLDNAQKYAGGSQVSVRSQISNQQVIVEVSDTGPGLKPEIWEQIAQAKPTRTGQGGRGFGLGLQVCKRLCKRLNGTLELIPSKRGTHYRISIPVKPNVQPELATVN